MKSLLILLKGNIYRFFKADFSMVKLSLSLIGFLAVGFYGFLLGRVYQSSGMFTPEQLLLLQDGLLFAVLATGVIKDFYPSYRNSSDVIGKQFALSDTRRWGINLGYDFLNPYWLVFGLLLGIPLIMAPNAFSSTALLCVTASLSVPPFSHIIRQLIDYKFRSVTFSITGLAGLIAAFSFCALGDFTTPYRAVGFLIIGIAAWYFSRIVYAQEKVGARSLLSGTSNSSRPFLWLAFTHPQLRKVCLLAIIFKAGFLVLALQSDDHFTELVYILFYSPIFIFSYFGNNIWGMTHGMFPTIQRITSNWKISFRYLTRILAMPVLIDAVITLVLVGFFRRDEVLFFFLFYLASTLSLTGVAFWSNHFLPKYIENSFSFSRNSTSFWANIIALIVTGMLSSAYAGPAWYALWILPLIITLTAVLYSIQHFEEGIRKVFGELANRG
jgi:hypothetical protein